MSILQSQNIPCPACGTETQFGVVFSVNADRRPDLREAILDGSFQRVNCEACGEPFRMEPEFVYLDLARKQWLLVRPVSQLADWDALEDAAHGLFFAAFGGGAPQSAQRLGNDLQVRVTFGWAGLREKLLCAERGLDDVTLELTKLAIMRGAEDIPMTDNVELRFGGIDGDQLRFAWIKPTTEQAIEALLAPRSLYDEIAADAAGWAVPRETLSAGPFVDIHRLLVPAGDEPLAAAE